MDKIWSNHQSILLILLLAGMSFFPFLGGVHLFDWDEINFAEISREMILLGDYGKIHIDFEPFYEKPPLFFWLQVLSMKLFGITEFAARFPNAICGLLSLWVLYDLGKKLKDRLFGQIWALAYLGSFLPHLYFKSGIIDPWFNLFIFLGFHFYLISQSAGKEGIQKRIPTYRHIILSGLFIGLAMLTKGPVGILVPALAILVFGVLNKFKGVNLIQAVLAGLFACCIFGLWLLFEYWQNGANFIVQFIQYQYRLLSTEDAGHGGFPGYHVVVILLGCLPSSFFFIENLFKPQLESDHFKTYRKWMIIILAVTVVLFSLVQSKIVHYSSFAYFPVTFLAAASMHKFWIKGFVIPRISAAIIGLLVLLILCAAISFPMLISDGQSFADTFFKQDDFAKAMLEKPVKWGLVNMLNAFFLLLGVAFYFVFRAKKHFPAMIWTIFLTGILMIQATLYTYPAKIENYTQRTAVNLYEKYSARDIYLIPYGFKTYAHLFYTSKSPEVEIEKDIFGPSDKDRYLITKMNKEKNLRNLPRFEFQERRFGYAIYKIKAGK